MSIQLSSLHNSPVDKSVKNIEIYATLPKNKKGLLSRSPNKTKQVIEDEEYMLYERSSRSVQTKSKGNKKDGEKRARSEERSYKNTKEFVSNSLTKETKKPKVEDNKQGKKQHKIRRKLLMGGLIKRKNRSMPDLREDELQLKDPPKEKIISKDDSMVDSISSQSNLSGYLSEGHLESTGNPNLLKSKLMRKSFYTNKFLHFTKVPPPPPMRTSSQLTKIESNKQQNDWCSEPQSLPYIHPRKDDVTYANGGMLIDKDNKNVMITQAQVHHNPEQPTSINNNNNNAEDIGFPLPPYPSPLNSISHSRQPSEELPPPPPPSSQDVDVVDGICPAMPSEQIKLEINKEESWIKELQTKQVTCCTNDHYKQELESKSIVKDLKSKFEQKSIIDSLITHAIHNLPADSISETIEAEENKVEKELKGALSKISFDNNELKRKSSKKKNVTFCEQVVLVATAEEDEVDSYIPNPILERVLRSVLHKDTPGEQNREVTKSVIPLKRNDSGQFNRNNLSLKPCYDKDIQEKSEIEVKEELPSKTYQMSSVQQLSQTNLPIVQPKLKAPLPEQIQKPVESLKNYRMSPIQQLTQLNQIPSTQQNFKSPTSQIVNVMSNLSINSMDNIQSIQNQNLTSHRFYSTQSSQQSNNQPTNNYPQQYQSLSPMGQQKPFLANEPYSLNYQPINECKLSCSPVNSRSNQSSLERNQTTRQIPQNSYSQHSPVESRNGHFRLNGDSQTPFKSQVNQMSNMEINTHLNQTSPVSPKKLYSQNNVRYNVSNIESNGQYQNNDNRTYNHAQIHQYQCQTHERLNNNPSHLTDNRTCYPRQPSPTQIQYNNNNIQHQINLADNRSNYIQTQQFDRLNTPNLSNDKTNFVQQGSPIKQQLERLNSIPQYNTNNCENKTGYLQQGVPANQAQQLERMAQHYENKTGGYIQQGLSVNQSQSFSNSSINNSMVGDNKSNNSSQCSPNYIQNSQNESRTSFPLQCSPVSPTNSNQIESRPPGYPRNNLDSKMSLSPHQSPGLLQRQRSMVNGFHSMPYTRPDNLAHLPPVHPKKESQPNFPRSQGETHSSSSLDRKQLQQFNNQQDNNNPTFSCKNRLGNSVQRTNTVRRPMTVYEPQQLPPYQHPPTPLTFKQQQQQPRSNSQSRSTTPNGTTISTNDPSRYTVYQQPPSPRLQDKCNMPRPTQCNLCRKKPANHPSIYCSDCDFYMSRFKSKAQSTTC